MWVHFFLFAMIILFCILQKSLMPYSEKTRLLLWNTFILFFVFIAFRAYNVGNDTPEYYRLFKFVQESASIKDIAFSTRYEIGYIMLNFFVSRITDNFSVLLIIITAFYLYSSLLLVRRYSKSPELSVVLMFTLSLFYLAMNIERQCISMAIFYLAIPFLEKKKRLLYCIMIVIASLFHSASIILIVLAFLPKIDFSNRKIVFRWVIISFAALVFLNFSMTKILSVFPYFEHYYTNSVYSEGGVRSASVAFCAIRIFILLLIKVVGGFDYQQNDSSEATSIFNILLFFDIIVAIASIGFNLFDRLENYFSLGYIIAVVNAISSLNGQKSIVQKRNKITVTVLSVAVSFAYMTMTVVFRSSWSGIFPYSFV